MCKTYEIHNTLTHDILVDNLTFDELAEQFAVYLDYFGEHITACYREHKNTTTMPTSRAEQYKSEWINYFDELQAMGNL